MIELNNKISIQQVIKVINNKTNEEEYLIMNEDTNEWTKISQNEYNKIRGKKNE